MNRQQYLLGKLTEEANEAAIESIKCQQFGLTDQFHSDGPTNVQRLKEELDDLMAIIEILNSEIGLEYTPDPARIEEKKAKVYHYFNYSIARGMVTES